MASGSGSAKEETLTVTVTVTVKASESDAARPQSSVPTEHALHYEFIDGTVSSRPVLVSQSSTQASPTYR